MLLLFLLTLPIILILFLHKTRNSVKALLPPGPPQLPVIGNLHQLASAADLHVYLWQLSKKHGPIFQMKLGSLPLIVISSPKLAKEILKTHDSSFCSRPKLLVPRKLSYNFSDIVFSPYNPHWREVRRIAVANLFSLAKLHSFRPVRDDEISRLVAAISRVASATESVNLSEFARVHSSNLICRIAFGRRCDEEESGKFEKLLHDVQTLMATFFVSDFFPAFGWVDKIAGLINRVDRTCEKLDGFYQGLIDEHLDPERVKPLEDDFVDVLIKIKGEKSSSVDFTWDHIKALLMNIFIAATESTAASTVWIMTALIKAPKSMEKVRSEIRNLCGRKGRVDEDDLPNLPYLKAVINEALRLYPPAPLLVPREAMEKCTVGGYEIPPKTVVYVNAWAVARDPEFWKLPDEFLPERFLDGDVDVRGQDFEVIPFGSGRRICPGMSMGLVDVGLTVANLLYSFDWELPDGIAAGDVDTDVLPGIAMRKKNALVLVPMKYD